MVRKRGGFKNFMRKLDGEPNPTVVDTSRFWFKGPRRSVTQVESLYKILSGEHQQLFRAFVWRDTPQGVLHWSEKAFKGSYLPQEDYAYIQYLIDNHS